MSHPSFSRYQPEIRAFATSGVLEFKMLKPKDDPQRLLVNGIERPQDEYTDEQFAADLKKASDPIAKMADRARANMRSGRGRRFPV